MNEQLYKYIKDILRDGDMDELCHVMDGLMADKELNTDCYGEKWLNW